ncbi:lysozyme [Massilia sp. YIM B02769]|uniref:lysozyme n=1 Tax=Massilia sp. YIM B02769 TaxID=3050129 RepID=UPI0025B72CA6|nr:lysozyme [Massilia sp. YIM B02769]MDN4059570.1 lysozyme [Massilia sp. YIM B02769]
MASIVGAAVAAALLTFTPSFEGTKLTTYRDLAGVLTYCTGATENAMWGKTYTPAECRAQLERDLERHAAGVARCVPMSRLTAGQRVAFVDAAYNIGVSAFCGSSMARRANAGDMAGACDALLMWNKVGGKEVRGLTRRRQAERELCLKGLL